MVENKNFISKAYRGVNDFFKRLSDNPQAFFSLALGGFLSCYITVFIRKEIMPIFSQEEILKRFVENSEFISIGLFEIVVFVISFITILIAPLLGKKDKKQNKKVFLFFIIAVTSVFFIIISAGRQRLDYITAILILFSCILFISILIDILKATYQWLKVDKKQKGQIDIAKLTFIWTIIVFIIGILK